MWAEECYTGYDKDVFDANFIYRISMDERPFARTMDKPGFLTNLKK